MPRTILLLALIGVWGMAYADWLAPGWLKFDIPSHISKPLSTTTTHDLGCGIRRTLRQAAIHAIEDNTPDWAKFWQWNFNPLEEEPAKENSPCQSMPGEQEE
ncbi:MAG: hypothetical protein AAGI69_29705 [Cyanobacteria bacterium P01_H01_bin.21]